MRLFDIRASLTRTALLHGLLPAALVRAVLLISILPAPAHAQVFVVGERTATADVATDFTPTEVQLPQAPMSERGRRELVRMLDAEQGFAHRALPMGAGLTLHANGALDPGPAAYRKMIFEKGESAAPGDRVVITAMLFKGDRIVIDLNGGPYEKHRFLKHVQLNDNPVVASSGEKATGSRVTLVFPGPIPELSAPEVKALLEPVIDFGVKSSDQAYGDTLPKPLRDAIAGHDVLVGMNHRMVLAALGAPESKVRERDTADPNGPRYEEWIYGHVPQTVRFVRFIGDRVSMVEIAALGKPMEIHDKDEMAGYLPPPLTREIANGDKTQGEAERTAVSPPTLLKPGEVSAANGTGAVQFPTDRNHADHKDSSEPKAAGQPPPPTRP